MKREKKNHFNIQMMFFSAVLTFNNASAFYSSISGERSTFDLIVHLGTNGYIKKKEKENEVEENKTSAHAYTTA